MGSSKKTLHENDYHSHLSRLGKEVEWVNYINGGHGMPTTSVEEVKDYHRRIIGWYDARLKGDPKKKSEERKADTPAQN